MLELSQDLVDVGLFKFRYASECDLTIPLLASFDVAIVFLVVAAPGLLR